jgi:hypothetical protein
MDLWQAESGCAIGADMINSAKAFRASTRRRRLFPCAALAILLLTGVASAARIDVDRAGDTPTVTVRGTLETNDGKRFADAIAGLTKALVMFSSNGGDLDAGLAIGRAIRQGKFSTAVPAGVQCASACALAWLGGTTRYMANSARIGFHAAYVEERGGPRESGVGNALVGAYLNGLGLPEAAVIFMTSAAPEEIKWLTMEDARKLGVSVALLTPQIAPGRLPPEPGPTTPRRRPEVKPDDDDPDVAGNDVPMGSPSGTPSGGPGRTGIKPLRPTTTEPNVRPSPSVKPGTVTRTALRQKAMDFISDYFDHWSDLDARAIGYFGDIYAETVDFYGRPTDRDEVMKAKQQFIARWPTRVYTVHADSLRITCDEGASNCEIRGLVDFEYLDSRHGARSMGVTDFLIGARFTSAGEITIFRENAKVVSQRPDR